MGCDVPLECIGEYFQPVLQTDDVYSWLLVPDAKFVIAQQENGVRCVKRGKTQ